MTTCRRLHIVLTRTAVISRIRIIEREYDVVGLFVFGLKAFRQHWLLCKVQ